MSIKFKCEGKNNITFSFTQLNKIQGHMTQLNKKQGHKTTQCMLRFFPTDFSALGRKSVTLHGSEHFASIYVH